MDDRADTEPDDLEDQSMSQYNEERAEPGYQNDFGTAPSLNSSQARYVARGGRRPSQDNHDRSRMVVSQTDQHYNSTLPRAFRSFPIQPEALSGVAQSQISAARATTEHNVNISQPLNAGHVDGMSELRAFQNSSQPDSLSPPLGSPVRSPRQPFRISSPPAQPAQGAPVARIWQTSRGAYTKSYRTYQAILSSPQEGHSADRPLDESKKPNVPSAPLEIDLVPEYKRKEKSRKFFVIGKVFATLWAEPAGPQRAPSDSGSVGAGSSQGTAITAITDGYTMGSFGEEVHSKIRRFIVIREDENSCTCLPILTYNYQGVSKKGVNKSQHAIVYTGRYEPPPLPAERPARGEMGLLPDAIRVDPDDVKEKLDPLSRIDFAKVYTIEHHAKVHSIGKINRNSMPAFEHQFRVVWSKSEIARPPMTPQTPAPSAKIPRTLLPPHSDVVDAYHILLGSGWSPERACAVLVNGGAQLLVHDLQNDNPRSRADAFSRDHRNTNPGLFNNYQAIQNSGLPN